MRCSDFGVEAEVGPRGDERNGILLISLIFRVAAFRDEGPRIVPVTDEVLKLCEGDVSPSEQRLSEFCQPYRLPFADRADRI